MLLRVIQERYNLCTGAGTLWREGCLCHAAGDAVGNSPHDRFWSGSIKVESINSPMYGIIKPWEGEKNAI